MAVLPTVFKFVQVSFLLYTAIAVIFTTHNIVLSPLSSFLFPSLTSASFSLGSGAADSSRTWSSRVAPHLYRISDSGPDSGPGSDSQSEESGLDDPWLLSTSISDAPMYWPASSSEMVERLGMAHGNSTPILENTYLSKAFAQSLHPTKIMPYFYRAKGFVEDDDITITTLVTSNRFKVFKQLVERYQGPISVTVHIPVPSLTSFSTFTFASLPASHPSIRALRELHALYHSSPAFSNYVDVHLALSPFASLSRPSSQQPGEGEGGRQFNVWRNVARLFARTEFVMMLDVDFAVCTDWRGLVRGIVKRTGLFVNDIEPAPVSEPAHQDQGPPREAELVEVVTRMKEGTAALVVPAFEYANQDDGADQRTFPTDKESLLLLARASPPKLTSFHASWGPGHNSTDYARWFALPAGGRPVYAVARAGYQSAYEPYVIMSKRASWCDERFTGYGGNKAACLFEMYLSGVDFFVLADHFLIHQSHKYEEEARREERKYNRKLYTDFKEETCLRYLYRYAREGTLHSAKAANAREECKKIKSVARMAAQLLDSKEVNVPV